MSAHNILYQMYQAGFLAEDPGNGETLTVTKDREVFPVVTVATETRTLARPTKAGLIADVVLDTDGGDLTLTVTGGYNQAGDTSITFADAGDRVTFKSVRTGATYQWQVLGSHGTTLAGVEEALTGVTAGVVTASKAAVADADKDIGDFRNVGYAGALTGKAGAAAAAVALRLGATTTEGLEIKVIDETVNLTNAVETNLTETVPAGAVILSVQANLQTTVVGDASGDNGLVKVGIGVTADPDKYGKSADLVKNHKIDTIPDWAVLSGAETVCVKGCDADGAAVTEKFVADVPAGTRDQVRVRIVYAVPNSLDDAA